MVRLVVGPDEQGGHQVVADLAGGAFGRGAWVHARPACIEGAARGGLSRGMKLPINLKADVLVEQLRDAATRRTLSLLQAARRAKLAGLGTTAVEEGERLGRVELLVLAQDAKASADLSAVRRLAARGRVRLFKTKAELGAAFGRDELALVTLLSADLASEVSRMISVSELEQPGRAHRVTEVG
jgi:predicted RNA-binding protein YlxR (DUF448 family)